jgi:O-antigen/teichoic acid export membrane protein
MRTIEQFGKILLVLLLALLALAVAFKLLAGLVSLLVIGAGIGVGAVLTLLVIFKIRAWRRRRSARRSLVVRRPRR